MYTQPPFVVRGRLGRLIPHPSNHAERWLGWREARPGETPEYTIHANPHGGALYVGSEQGQPTRYEGRDIHLVREWQTIESTSRSRALIPRAYLDGDLDGPELKAAEDHAARTATLIAASQQAQEQLAANTPAAQAKAATARVAAEAARKAEEHAAASQLRAEEEQQPQDPKPKAPAQDPGPQAPST